MVMSAAPTESKRMTCPCCQRYIGTVDGTYAEYPPCVCGAQTTVRLTGRRARQCVSTPAGPLEVKAR